MPVSSKFRTNIPELWEHGNTSSCSHSKLQLLSTFDLWGESGYQNNSALKNITLMQIRFSRIAHVAAIRATRISSTACTPALMDHNAYVMACAALSGLELVWFWRWWLQIYVGDSKGDLPQTLIRSKSLLTLCGGPSHCPTAHLLQDARWLLAGVVCRMGAKRCKFRGNEKSSISGLASQLIETISFDSMVQRMGKFSPPSLYLSASTSCRLRVQVELRSPTSTSSILLLPCGWLLDLVANLPINGSYCF